MSVVSHETLVAACTKILNAMDEAYGERWVKQGVATQADMMARVVVAVAEDELRTLGERLEAAMTFQPPPAT